MNNMKHVVNSDIIAVSSYNVICFMYVSLCPGQQISDTVSTEANDVCASQTVYRTPQMT